MRKLSPGDQVYVVAAHYRWSRTANHVATVDKVGRKWVYVGRNRYDVVTGREDDNGYASDSIIYDSEESYLAMERYRTAAKNLREAVKISRDEGLIEAVGGVAAAEGIISRLSGFTS